jgi:hypothetical protein
MVPDADKTQTLFMRIPDHDLLLKDLASYPVPGMAKENHKNISVRIASLWV